MTPVHDSFAIERVFHACPAHVFACWADPELKRQWFVDSDGPAWEEASISGSAALRRGGSC